MVPLNAGNRTEIAKVAFKGKISKLENWNFLAFGRSFYQSVSIIYWLLSCKKNQLRRKEITRKYD